MRSNRSTRGVVATSDSRASEAGAEILRSGGNALDAAVAAALVLYVVEPQSCGPGGDAFLLWCPQGDAIEALDGSGDVPAGLTQEALAHAGFDTVPGRGAMSITVPGAVSLLGDAVTRFGTLPLSELAAAAITLARHGFATGPTLALASTRAAELISEDPVLGPLYVPDGSPLREGQMVSNQAIASLFEMISAGGADAMYSGAVADAIVSRTQAAGGCLAKTDLDAQKTISRTPQSTSFREHVVWEFGHPTQGPAVLDALLILEEIGPNPPWTKVVDAVSTGMTSGGFDPRSFGARPTAAKGDTTYIAAVDGDGNGASLITSVFGDFGAHFGVPDLGGSLGNRAAMFRALGIPPTPGVRPPHTTIPAAVTRGGELAFVLGVAGGLMQPQAQVQLLIRLVDEALPPQEAVDRPRFKIVGSGDVALESGHPLAEIFPAGLSTDPGPEGYGGAQVVGWDEGTLCGGADHRRHGSVAET